MSRLRTVVLFGLFGLLVAAAAAASFHWLLPAEYRYTVGGLAAAESNGPSAASIRPADSLSRGTDVSETLPAASRLTGSDAGQQAERTPFQLYSQGIQLGAYEEFVDALHDALAMEETAVIEFRDADHPIWSNETPIPETAYIEGVPVIYQMPELERGCEVTSLAMLLSYAGVGVDKMALAEQIAKDPTPYGFTADGEVFYGNPNDGFVGSIYTFEEDGLGVYHGPVKQLAERYLPGQVVDMTGSRFDDVLAAVSTGAPVWIIANSNYYPLPDDDFETWMTPSGEIAITYLEHSLVVVGYDADTVTLNGPQEGEITVNRADFAAAWEQMGRQAIRIVA